MVTEYSGSGMNPDSSLGSRWSVDEFIKSQLYDNKTPEETRVAREVIRSRINPDEQPRSQRMTTEYIKSQLDPNENVYLRMFPNEGLETRMSEENESSVHSDKNLESGGLTNEYIKSQLHPDESFGSRREIEEYIRSRLTSNDKSAVFRSNISETSRVRRLTSEYIRSQLFPDEIRGYRYPSKDYTEPRIQSSSNLGSRITSDEYFGSERMTNEYIRFQLYPDDPARPESGSEPILLSKILAAPRSRAHSRTSNNQQRRDSRISTYQQHLAHLEPNYDLLDPRILRSRLDSRPNRNQQPATLNLCSIRLSPESSGNSTAPDPELKHDLDLEMTDLDPKLDIDPRNRRINEQFGTRRQFDSRIISTVEPCHEEATFYSVR